jgi:hypothetical protein
MRTARKLGAEWRQVVRGGVITGAKEDESSIGHVWAAGFHNVTARGGVSSTRDLGPTMTVRGQSIGISIGMLDKHIRTTLGLKRGAPLKSVAWGGRPT